MALMHRGIYIEEDLKRQELFDFLPNPHPQPQNIPHYQNHQHPLIPMGGDFACI